MDTNKPSPKTPFKRGMFKTDSSRFIELHRTPRSEGFHRHKIILNSPSSSEVNFSTSPPAWTAETPPLSNSEEVPTPFKEILRNRSIVDKEFSNYVIPERKFYNSTSRRKSLLPLFNQSAVVPEDKADAVIQQSVKRTTSKRKRSKSLDYRSRSKSLKLNKEVRHGVKRPKLKKTQNSPSTNKSVKTDVDDHSVPTTSPCNSAKKSGVLKNNVTPSVDIKPKTAEKKISVKVNRMVRMNLQCGEIKFTKHTISPKKTPMKRKTGDLDDALDVPETEDWIKNKVDNILDSLDKENCDTEGTGVAGQTCESETSLSLNDTATHLSDAFCVLGVREFRGGIQPTATIEEDVSCLANALSDKGGETLENHDTEMEVTSVSADSSSHNVSAEKFEDSNGESSDIPNDKFYSVFYKPAPGKPKENTPTSTKSERDSPRFPFKRDFFQSNDGMEQLVIDAGQKALGPSTCSECGFFYQKGDHSEEKMHKMYHRSSKPAIKHMGWKWERVAVKFPEGRVIRVCSSDPKSWWTKVEAVLEKANDDLGISFTSKIPKDAHAYMYVGDGHILGCVIAEPIRIAYRMLESDRKEIEKIDIPEDDKVLELPKTPSFCSNTPVRGSRCGINRIWTCASERRKGIATKMLDAIRATFVYGHILRLDEIAFSDPTPLGMAFAQKYTKVPNFLVYKLNKE